MSVFEELDSKTPIKPTPEWMQKWYPIMNDTLFGGRLGECQLGIFSTGRGASGSVLGWFKITGKNIYTDTRTSRMFYSGRDGNIFVHKDNFAELCKPVIELNSNYRAPESYWIDTLIHEMCHYYTYMFGVVPKQGHGKEFRQIAAYVSSLSEGHIDIKRLADAEKMEHFDLDTNIKLKNKMKQERKYRNVMHVIVVCAKGIQLLNVEDDDMIDEVLKHHEFARDTYFAGISRDKSLCEYLINNGYRKIMKRKDRLIGYDYWDLRRRTDVLFELTKYDWKKLCGKYETLNETLRLLGYETYDTKQEDVNDDTSVKDKDDNEVNDKEKEKSDRASEGLGLRAVREGDGFNLVDRFNHRLLGHPVSDLWFNENDNRWYFTLGKHMFVRNDNGKWRQITENKIRRIMEEKAKRGLYKFIRENVNSEIDRMLTEIEGGEGMVRKEKMFDDAVNGVEITPDMNLGLHSPIEGL